MKDFKTHTRDLDERDSLLNRLLDWDDEEMTIELSEDFKDRIKSRTYLGQRKNYGGL